MPRIDKGALVTIANANERLVEVAKALATMADAAQDKAMVEDFKTQIETLLDLSRKISKSVSNVS